MFNQTTLHDYHYSIRLSSCSYHFYLSYIRFHPANHFSIHLQICYHQNKCKRPFHAFYFFCIHLRTFFHPSTHIYHSLPSFPWQTFLYSVCHQPIQTLLHRPSHLGSMLLRNESHLPNNRFLYHASIHSNIHHYNSCHLTIVLHLCRFMHHLSSILWIDPFHLYA